MWPSLGREKHVGTKQKPVPEENPKFGTSSSVYCAAREIYHPENGGKPATALRVK